MNPEEIPKKPDLESTQGPASDIETLGAEDGAYDPLSQIRTYQGDVASALGNQKESLVSIQHAEVARRRSSGTPEPAEPSSGHRALLLVIGSIVLLVLAIFGGWFTYRTYIQRSTPPATVIPESRLISSAQEESFAVATTTTRAELIKTLRDASMEVPADAVKNIVLRNGISPDTDLLKIESFLRILETDAPGSLVRSFKPVFMFGSLGGATSSSFIIIKLNSFENAFAGMLDWESAMASDIGPIFPSAERLKNVTSLTNFEDVTDKNKDARVLYDPDGQEVLLYSFLNNDILIITDNIATLHIIISRLTAESLVR